MPEPFSLAGHAWLPVALASGRRVLVRPCDIGQPFEGEPILRIATGRPDCDISLAELLIGLLTVAMSPRDEDEWASRYRNPPSTREIEMALASFADALVLDGEGPRFFQDIEPFEASTPAVKLKRTEQLFVDAPGENTIEENADHFVKRGTLHALSRPGVAIALATIQTMSPSGGPGKLTSVRGGGPLTTLVVPGSHEGEVQLWNKLWANVPIGKPVSAAERLKVFPWLAPTRQGAKGGIKTTPLHVHDLQAFFGLPRRVRLVFEPNLSRMSCALLGIVDDVIVRNFADRPKGTDYEAWDKKHPLSPYYKPKPKEPEFLPVHLQSSRIGYRDWLAITLGSENGARVSAACVDQFKRYGSDLLGDKESHRNTRLLAAGYAMDSMKALDFGEALLPLIFASTPDGNGRLSELAEAMVSAANSVAYQLTSSVKLGLYGERSKASSDSAVLGPVRDRFWSETETGFYDVLRSTADRVDIPGEEWINRKEDVHAALAKAWLAVLRRRALDIFDDSVPIDSADADRIEDIVNARKFLVLALEGYGKAGAALYKTLGLPPKPKKGGPK